LFIHSIIYSRDSNVSVFTPQSLLNVTMSYPLNFAFTQNAKSNRPPQQNGFPIVFLINTMHSPSWRKEGC
ncbi:MAG: hypothetical protein K8S87_06515, partial [Planctomycetes bacterium]|nr:hypothetical protein [Planctomycetota bacterium]